jgi:hypothetical protein
MRTRCTGASSVSSVKRLRSSWGKAWASVSGDSALPIQKLPVGTFTKAMPSELVQTCGL